MTEDLFTMMTEKGIEDVEKLSFVSGIDFQLLVDNISNKRMKLRNIMKLTKVLGCYPYQLIYGMDSNHRYWYIDDERYPVDLRICEKCKFWSKNARWCVYREQTGEMLPDDHIVLHENGRSSCTCQTIGKHERKMVIPL